MIQRLSLLMLAGGYAALGIAAFYLDVAPGDRERVWASGYVMFSASAVCASWWMEKRAASRRKGSGGRPHIPMERL